MESSIQIEERAAAWLAKRDSGDWTVADEDALQHWLTASTANRVAYLRLEAAWEAAGRLQVFAGAHVPSERQDHPFLEEPRLALRATSVSAPVSEGEARVSGKVRIHHPYRALAASFLVAVAIGAGWYLWPSGPSYRTAVGGVSAVPMVDGSRITLNTDSEVRVAVTETERRVELAQGEAFFDVARDPTRPFVVEAGNERFIAVGTKFSVLRTGDANRLVVTEGRVRVESSAALPTEVPAGGIARSGKAGVLVEKRPVAEAETMLSWRSGYLVFDQTPLADAVAEFNRYNTDKIVIEDASVAGILIGGNFRSTNVDAFVRLLEDGFPIRVAREGERIVLSQN